MTTRTCPQDPQEVSRPRPSPRILKILGERNTGTTYLDRLVARNLEVDRLRGVVPGSIERFFPKSEFARDLYFYATRRWNLGWKHAAAPGPDELARSSIDPRCLLFLTLTKNPYSWLLSLYERPYHAKLDHPDFETFLAAPWETVQRENARAVFESPVDLWNEKNAAYLELGRHATVFHCRYEDLLTDPIDFLDRLVSEYDIGVRRSPFENVVEASKPRDRSRGFDDYRDYYLEERWREGLTPASVELINDRLDGETMRRFGYSRIDPASL